MGDAFGILSYGAYLPRRRLQRKVIATANGWFNPGLRALAKGERAMADWDEDSVNKAGGGGRDFLAGGRPPTHGPTRVASTTHPLHGPAKCRVVATALHLDSALRVLDVTGSLRAGTSALATALAAGRSALVAAGGGPPTTARAAPAGA